MEKLRGDDASTCRRSLDRRRKGTRGVVRSGTGYGYLIKLQPDHPAYNISLAVRVSGALDVAALELSLSEIVAHHEILRATFRRSKAAGRRLRRPSCFHFVVDLTGTPKPSAGSERAGSRWH